MADYAFCNNHECPSSVKCYRYKATRLEQENLRWADCVPTEEFQYQQCEYYIPLVEIE